MDNDTIGMELRNRSYDLCSKHIGGAWARIGRSDFEITQISGGASNLLYCCHLPKEVIIANGEPTQILIRFYGDQSRTDEIAIQCQIFDLLSKKSLGPKLYGTFDEGRLEEFLPADSLTCDQIRDLEVSRIISEKLAVVHSLSVPINKDESWLIGRLQEWTESISKDFDSIVTVEHSSNWPSTRDTARKLLAINFQQEIQFIKEEVFEKSTSIKVFSHNDLHQGNILFAEPSKQRPTLKERIVFIDFEYCSYNYRAYDIANHLCEWLFQYGNDEYPHFTCYQEKFPTREEQLNFIHHYLSEIIRLRNLDTQQNNDNNNITINNFEGSDQQDCKSSECEEEIEEVVIEEDEEEQEEEEIVEKEEEAEYDDDYILCNDRREITGDIQSIKESSFNENNNIINKNNKKKENGNLFINVNTNGHSNIVDKKTIPNGLPSPSQMPLNGLNKLIKNHKSTSNTSKMSRTESEEDLLFDEIQPFYMAVSLFWTLWCVKQAQTSTIKFGYWEHAMNRWNLYTQFKSAHLKAMANKNPDCFCEGKQKH